MVVEKLKKYWRVIPVGVLFWYFMYSALNSQDWHFIDGVDLIIHEAGHWVFIFFGQFVSILGGSLIQILIPLVFVLYFFFRRDFFSASILLMWLGYNFVNISVYMADAVRMQLPLLGGDFVIHDWNYIFNALGLLEYSGAIADLVRIIGIFVIITGAVLSFRYLVDREDVK